MTDSREPSYYEIALTNRQVMTVFVILLVCVVAAFFSGVWVGRSETAQPPIEVGETPPVEGEAPEETLGELNFFTDEAEAVEPGPPAPAPRSQPPAEPPAAPADPSPGAVPAVEPAAGAIVVQVFSSNDREQAERVVNRLRSAGFAALLSPVEVRDRTMYRVRIGPFQERREAEQVAERVRRDFRLDTWITSG
ncbi:MAG: SPOR domain-containing protein [Thermoanaerobaculia bacterium]|nr:SPOR domain-containing protein [Thermoanaerobaculia bacterium]